MNRIIRRQLGNSKRRIERRLDRSDLRDCSRRMFRTSNIHYEISGRDRAVGYGGIGSMQLLVQRLGLAEAIDERLQLLKIHLPYHESDHVLNIAYNALCDGTCLQDLEIRRQDEVYLDAVGAKRIPDPTTEGDFCRRFDEQDVRTLIDTLNQVRVKVWARQPAEFFAEARIDFDGVVVGTRGECKEGMDIAYNGVWGYHPLIMSLANTGEVLSIINRSGNRPSHEGAAEEADRAIELCQRAGFGRVLLRGDTDFSQTKHLDRWDEDGRVRFIFGMDVSGTLHILADDLAEKAWHRLERPVRYEVKTQPRQRPDNVKEQVVREREFQNTRLEFEEVAEFSYRPVACRKAYRIVVVRKQLSVEKGEQLLFSDYRYFFYITNDWTTPAAEIVFLANDRCDQENLNAQLKGGVRALQAPVDGLVSNWAYMVMTALAWNLKAWWALWPEERAGRWVERHRQEKHTVLRMEFKTFVNAFMRLPCQIIKTGRRLIYRMLSWNPWQPLFFRTVGHLRS